MLPCLPVLNLLALPALLLTQCVHVCSQPCIGAGLQTNIYFLLKCVWECRPWRWSGAVPHLDVGVKAVLWRHGLAHNLAGQLVLHRLHHLFLCQGG